nr:MAG TPA_asm: hypothetical protein [Caudoviricetes sp.]
MKVKDLIKELEYFYLEDEDSEVLAYLYDKETDTEYKCEIKVDGDITPMLILEEVRRYKRSLNNE